RTRLVLLAAAGGVLGALCWLPFHLAPWMPLAFVPAMRGFRLAESPRDEVISLLAPMCGAYFGELIRRQLQDGTWEIDPDDHSNWRLSFDNCSLTFNPIGIALEVILAEDVPDWGAHLQTSPEDQLRVKKALEVFGDVRDRDYYTFSVRFEAIEQAYLGLLNNPEGMDPKG
ncbi:MAG: hypothetical protein JSV06_12400, partial [Myxococcales bacterium]